MDIQIKKFISFMTVFAVTAIGFAGIDAAERMPIGDVVNRLQSVYDSAKDFKAGFSQEATIKSLKKTEKESGTVYFKKPRRMLWDYNSPQAKKLVINPKTAWLYVPADNMAYEQDSKALLNSRLTIRFLTGIGKLSDDFDISYSKPETDKDGNFLIDLVPKSLEAGAGIESLSATIDRNTFLISRVIFKDMYGNVTRIQFHNMKINNELSDSIFNFKPPKGVRIQKVS